MEMTLVMRAARTFISAVTNEDVSFEEAIRVMEKMLYRSAADGDMRKVLNLVRSEMDGSQLRGTGQE